MSQLGRVRPLGLGPLAHLLPLYDPLRLIEEGRDDSGAFRPAPLERAALLDSDTTATQAASRTRYETSSSLAS